MARTDWRNEGSATRPVREGWHVLSGAADVRAGDRFFLDGIERAVVVWALFPPRTVAVRYLPDFERPECAACGLQPEPPDADRCLDGCRLWPLQPVDGTHYTSETDEPRPEEQQRGIQAIPESRAGPADSAEDQPGRRRFHHCARDADRWLL